MLPLREAQKRVLEQLDRLPTASSPLASALGLTLARSATAPHPVPPFANSAMDGYAVRADDVVATPTRLEVIEDLPAGSVASRVVEAGTAIKIMTGAPVPAGADAVVRVEDTEQTGSVVTIRVGVPRGTSVRPAGGDVAEGQEIVATGLRLTPAHLGVLANNGFAQLDVVRRPKVAVASTGDELIPVDIPELGPGQIRDSNRPMLVALLVEAGVEVVDLGRIPDRADVLRSTLARGGDEADVIITTGGVSMGEYDLVKEVLSESGEIDFWQVAMQPAKPFAFGRLGSTPFFGLPGNPVSAFVAFEQFVRPGLMQMMGSLRIARPRIPARSREPLETDRAKTVFVRVRSERDGGQLWFRSAGGQSSNVLSAVAAGDALAVVEEGVERVEEGDEVMLEMYRWPEARTIDEL